MTRTLRYQYLKRVYPTTPYTHMYTWYDCIEH